MSDVIFFTERTAFIWNSLPPSVVEFRSLSSFKKTIYNAHVNYLHGIDVLCCLLTDIVLVHGQVTIIFVVSVGLSVCLSVCAEFFSAVFDPILIKLGHMLYVWV